MKLVYRDKNGIVVLFSNQEFSKIMTLLTLNHDRDPVLDEMLQSGLKQIFPGSGKKSESGSEPERFDAAESAEYNFPRARPRSPKSGPAPQARQFKKKKTIIGKKTKKMDF